MRMYIAISFIMLFFNYYLIKKINYKVKSIGYVKKTKVNKEKIFLARFLFVVINFITPIAILLLYTSLFKDAEIIRRRVTSGEWERGV